MIKAGHAEGFLRRVSKTPGTSAHAAHPIRKRIAKHSGWMRMGNTSTSASSTSRLRTA